MKKILAVIVLGLLIFSSADAYSGRKAEAKGKIYVGISKSEFCSNTLNYPCADAKKKKKNKKNKYPDQYFYDGKNYEIISTDDFRFYLFKNVTLQMWRKGKTVFSKDVYGNGILISMHDTMSEAKKTIELDIAGKFKIKKEKKKTKIAKSSSSNSLSMSTDDKITQSKQICRDLGFKTNTEKFADCALKMMSIQFEATNKVASGSGTTQEIIVKHQNDYDIFDAMIDMSNAMLSNNKKSSSSSSNRGTNCVIGRTNPTFGTTTMNCN